MCCTVFKGRLLLFIYGICEGSTEGMLLLCRESQEF